MSAAGSDKVPVLACVRDAWRMAFGDAAGLLPAAGVAAIASVVAGLLSMSAAGGYLIGFGVQLAGSAVFAAAALRKMVRGERTAPMGIAFGADEMRLIGVALSLFLVFIPFAVLILLVVWIVLMGRVAGSTADMEAFEGLMNDPDALTVALSEALGPSGQIALSLFMILIAAIVMVLAARLVAVNAATIGEKRIVIFQTWSWAHGNVWRIIAAILLTTLPAMLVGSLMESISRSLLQAGPASVVNVMIYAGVSGLVSAYANLPGIALGAVLYRGLRPRDFVAK